MSTLTIFQIALEVWGIVICLIALLITSLEHIPSRSSHKLRFVMQISCIYLLINDILAWTFRGHTDSLAYHAVRISNFNVFFINFIYMSLFSIYLWQSISSSSKLPKRIFCIFGLSLVGVATLILSQFTNLFYYFDQQNFYHRSSLYFLSQCIALIGILLNLSILLQYRKNLPRSLYYAFLSYFILPTLATITLIFYYGLSLQNLAFVISTQIMFVVDIVDVSQQLTESQKAYLLANYQAEHDAMTGLWNKTAIKQQIQTYFSSKNSSHPSALLFIDIDDFKKINDTSGHMVGDFWIQEISRQLLRVFHKNALISRFGGDEYMIFIKAPIDSKTLAYKLKLFQCNLSLKCKNNPLNVHCSIGAYIIHEARPSLEKCIERADQALYQAKEAGKNTFVINENSKNN